MTPIKMESICLGLVLATLVVHDTCGRKNLKVSAVDLDEPNTSQVAAYSDINHCNVGNSAEPKYGCPNYEGTWPLDGDRTGLQSKDLTVEDRQCFRQHGIYVKNPGSTLEWVFRNKQPVAVVARAGQVPYSLDPKQSSAAVNCVRPSTERPNSSVSEVKPAP